MIAQGSPARGRPVRYGNRTVAAGRRDALPSQARAVSLGDWMTIEGACANNLCGDTVRLPLGVLAGVCGVSGSGKSTLLIDTLGRALAPKKQTTSVAYEPIRPGDYESIEGAPARVVVVDQAKAGVTNPADFLNLSQPCTPSMRIAPTPRLWGSTQAHCRAVVQPVKAVAR